MSLIVYSLSTNYVIALKTTYNLPYYDMGIFLNSRTLDANKTSSDLDTILYPSIIPVYQTNLTTITNNNTITSDLNNTITNSNYGLTFNINNMLATTPNSMYSTLLTDSTLPVNDTNTRIYDSQYTSSSIWVNNTQTTNINSPSSFISM